jgi:hypothetical protein
VNRPHGPLFTQPRRRFIRLWAVFALLNLAAGVVVALQPDRSTDLDSVMRWGRQWLVDGANVYDPAYCCVDYPPHAIVLLSPLSLLPSGAAFPLWVIVNLGLVLLAPYFAARCFQPHASLRSILLPVLMFASWWGAHTLVQFSLLALTLSMVSLFWADRKPLGSGVCLGLAFITPQVALPVLLWTLFTRRWKVAAGAAVVVAIGAAVFCLRAHANPVDVARGLLSEVALYHRGDAIPAGVSELRPLIAAFVTDLSKVDLITDVMAGALLAAICVVGFQEGQSRRHILYAAPPLVACWSLLTFYHLSYGCVVLLPVLMLLVFNDAEQTPLRKGVFWLLQLGMMVDMPGLVRRSGLDLGPPVANVLAHADRVLVLLIFAGLVTLAWRE